MVRKMNLEERIEKAIELKHSGNNCAVSILLVYNDLLNLDTNLLKKLGSGFGSGMGGMKATCGALIGANLVLGLLNNSEIQTKMISKDMLNEFEEKCKATLCKDLKGIETRQVLASCEYAIETSIRILDSKLANL